MSSFFKLFIANLKLDIRNKQALFWRLVFPIIFVIVFGLFDLDNLAASKMAVIDYAHTDISQKIVDGFSDIDFIKIKKETDLQKAKTQLKKNRIDFIIVMPEDIKDINTDLKPTVSFDPRTRKPIIKMPEEPKPVTLKVFYNEGNVASNQLVLNMLSQITTQINAAAGGAPKLFELKSEPLTKKKIRYIDFLMPGIIAMGLMNSAIIGIAVYMTEYREKKILKRLLATPVDRKTFVFSQIFSRLILAIIQSIVIVSVALLAYNVKIYGSYLAILAWVVLLSIVFLNIGFIISGFAKTSQAAESLSQIIALPLMFLSGVFFSTDTLPKIVKSAVDHLPLAPGIDALRKIIINGDGIASTKNEMVIVGAWIVITFVMAISLFRVARE